MPESLEHRVRERGPRPFGEVGRMVTDVSRAVGQAHLRKRGHGGIVPSAVLCVPGEGARATRFTLAPAREPWVPFLAWSAFEVVARGARPSPASDVFALGLVAFHALAGASLWRSVDEAGRVVDPVALARELGEPPGARERLVELGVRVRVAVPAGFDGWLRRCVARCPAERFPSAPRAARALVALASPSLARSKPAPLATPWQTARE